jgi:peptidoglycan/LPS O-acetylase OafA/YrhL
MTATRAEQRATRPAPAGHQDALDGLRAVAALLVLLFHTASITGRFRNGYTPADWLLSRAEVAVPIFFTLSGLLLFRPWARSALEAVPGPRTLTYLWKRATRILPAYWLVVVAAMFLYAGSRLGDPRTWIEYLTLTFIYDPHAQGLNGLDQMWSLAVEVSWYLLLPITGMLLRWFARTAGPHPDRAARRLLLGIAVYAALPFAYQVFISASPWNAFLVNWLPRDLGWFAAGMALATVSAWSRVSEMPVRFYWTVGSSWGLCWIVAALLYCIASTPLTGFSRQYSGDVWSSVFMIVLYGLIALFVVAPVALAPTPAMNGLLGGRVMRFLGKISYGIFLWQFVVIFVWYDLSGQQPFTGSMFYELPVITLLTVGLSTLTYYLVEEPVRRFTQRRI